MGEAVAKVISERKEPYNPGIWFNSAKFFDIEYQTYGSVQNKLRETEEEFYWEHENGEIAMHFIYNKSDKTFIGINTFGIRLRQQQFEKWLSEKRDIYYVLENLKETNFDPEFFKRYEMEIANSFNTLNPNNKVTVKEKGFFSKLLTGKI